MRGSIDRLVLRYDAPEDKTGGKYGNIPAEVEIIDFKTDRISSDPEKLKERSAHYAPQLEAYRTAVAKLYGISPASIRTRLLFTSSDVKNA